MGLRKIFILVLALAVMLTTFMVESLFFRTRVLNVSAVEAVDDIGVYWDENCSMSVHSISWGVLSPGEVKKVVVYVRNEGNESFTLVLTPINWNPDNASRYLIFSWSCEDNRIGVGNVVKVTQSLLVSPYTKGITDFSFDIVFDVRRYFVSDVNGDGQVEMLDIFIIINAFMSQPGGSGWNPLADINKDDVIDILDLILVIKDFGRIWEH